MRTRKLASCQILIIDFQNILNYLCTIWSSIDNQLRKGFFTPHCEMALSLEEKLQLIDQEIRTLHQFCLGQGLSDAEITKHASPILQPISRLDKQRAIHAWKHRAKVAALVTLLALGMFYIPPVYRSIRVYTRLTQIKMLPYWDWASYYNSECLIENPYFEGEQLSEEDCEVCDGIKAVERIQNMSQHTMAEDYLKRDVPVVVTDAMADWPAMEKFSMPFLHELYKNEEKLKDIVTMPCMFHTNVRTKVAHLTQILTLLRRAAQGDLKNWYAHWENCGKVPGKFMRQFFRRPYFFPAMVEAQEGSWLMVSKNYTGKLFKPIDLGTPMTWIGQLKGQNKIKLSPKEPCQKTCDVMYVTLYEGEMLVVTDLIWYLDYLPNGTGENIAMAAGGQFD